MWEEFEAAINAAALPVLVGCGCFLTFHRLRFLFAHIKKNGTGIIASTFTGVVIWCTHAHYCMRQLP